MKGKPEISHRSFGGSGPLSIYWTQPPYGSAKDCAQRKGVCWKGEDGSLLAVEFDDVADDGDCQTLTIHQGIKVEVSTKRGKIAVLVTKPSPRKRLNA